MIHYKKTLLPKYFKLAVSGGVDSLAACFFLYKKGYRFNVIHLNNKLIKQDDEVAEKVSKFCNKFNIPLFVTNSNDKYNGKGSVEEFARNCRKQFYSLMGGDIVLAHHLGDCVTSYLWDCLRGHSGRMPIPEKTVFVNYTIWRPFLLTEKESFIDLINKNNLCEFVTEDELNKDLSLNRNWIREKLVKDINSRNYNINKVVRKIISNKLRDKGY